MTDFITASRGAIFDLDGVIVDTAKYHYLAWRRLATELGFEFTEQHNERLKGVSRLRSLEILLEIGGLTFDEERMQELAARKNTWYVEYISRMDASETLPGAREYVVMQRVQGKKTALGSASRNAGMILKNLDLEPLFDAVIDGTKVGKAKPDPEVFLLGARELGIPPSECVVYEDAEAGVEAGLRAGMKVVGIGDSRALSGAHRVVPGLWDLVPGARLDRKLLVKPATLLTNS